MVDCVGAVKVPCWIHAEVRPVRPSTITVAPAVICFTTKNCAQLTAEVICDVASGEGANVT
jgi:hypothetical protein